MAALEADAPAGGSKLTPVFALTRRIQFAETDLACVLHFSNYFRLMEEVEHAFFRSLGFSVVTDVDGVTVSWPRVSVTCEYRAPLRFEDEVELRLAIVRLGAKSMSFEVDFVHEEQNKATGRITAICCATGPNGAFTSIPIPDVLRAKLSRHVRGA